MRRDTIYEDVTTRLGEMMGWKGLASSFTAGRDETKLGSKRLCVPHHSTARHVGGFKTVRRGGTACELMVDNNRGLYESSTISTIAIG